MLKLLSMARALNDNYVTESKPAADIEVDGADQPVSLYYWGQESSPGVMAGWDIALCGHVRLLNPVLPALVPAHDPQGAFGSMYPAVGQSPMFLHVTQTKFLNADGQGLAGRVVRATGDAKEFGPGFYTMSPDSFASGDCTLVGTNWFNKPGQTWSVVGFEIPKQPNFWGAFISEAGGRDVADLVFYLTNIRGHVRGGAVPNAEDVAAIERINLLGKALIFPNDDSRVRVPGAGGPMNASDVSNLQGANLPGAPWVVIGPQRPPFMNGARQVAWLHGLGLWLMNSSRRFHVYRDQ